MDPIEFVMQLDVHPTIKFVVGVVVMLLTSKALSSENEAAKRLWGVAKIHQWWKQRQEREADLEEEIASRRLREITDEIARVDKARLKDKQMFLARIEQLEQTETMQHTYIVWVTQIMRNIEIWAAEQGLTLPRPPFITYPEWLKKGNSNNHEQTVDNRPDMGKK